MYADPRNRADKWHTIRFKQHTLEQLRRYAAFRQKSIGYVVREMVEEGLRAKTKESTRVDL